MLIPKQARLKKPTFFEVEVALEKKKEESRIKALLEQDRDEWESN
jgi:hypothetical protein